MEPNLLRVPSLGFDTFACYPEDQTNGNAAVAGLNCGSCIIMP
jgi:hypothetical protein